MDKSESLAHEHLIFRGFQDVVYEPDGNVPPDFLVNGRIAVEVRRLNENERNRPEPRGLEEVEIPLLKRLNAVFGSYGTSTSTRWWVVVRFKRPMQPMRQLEPAVRDFLDHVRTSCLERASRAFGQSLVLEVWPRRETGSETFALAITSDDDSGGWLIEDLERNLRICITEKTKKIAPYKSRYSEWWLIFIDRIAFGLAEDDRRAFRQSVNIDHTWNKVILVSAADHAHYFEF